MDEEFESANTATRATKGESRRSRRAHCARLLLAGAAAMALSLCVATSPAAAATPAEAVPGEVFALEHASAYQLRFLRTPVPTQVAVDQLVRGGALEQVSLREVLASADRTAYQQDDPRCAGATAAVTALDAEETGGYCWDAVDEGDGDTNAWIPQAITQAPPDERVEGRRPLVVGWHAPKDAGARLSFLNPPENESGEVPFADVLLLDASGNPAHFAVAALHSHVGGIGWWGDRLYVTKTWVGMQVYDTSRIYRVSTGKDIVGVDPGDGRFYANGFRYVMFPVGAYERVLNGPGDSPRCDRTPESILQNYCFSALSVDPGSRSLVTAEYRSPTDSATDIANGQPARILHWPLTDSGALHAERGVVHAGAALGTYTRSIQGVAVHDGTYYLSTSNPHQQPGTLWIDTAEAPPRSSPWGIGAEAVLYQAEGSRVWSLTEYRHLRMLFWVRGPR